MRLLPLLAALALLAPAAARADGPVDIASAAAGERPARETNCGDGIDNDGDTVTDCGDSDCWDAPECQPSGKDENTDGRCSNWLDDDGDTLVDCDDPDCYGPGITVCLGSMDLATPAPALGTPPVPTGALRSDAPKVERDPESYIGTDGDLDGERSNEVCGDGLDNDGDGRIDCEDYGCRYDPSVTVCQAAPGMRFSVVVGAQTFWQDQSVNDQHREIMTARLERLQLRALGPMPLIANSFFLISIRAERNVRTTFAMFQIPLGNEGHYLNLNTGSGGLSSALITSTANQLLLDPANYVYRAFEQGNGLALEVGGPVLGNLIRYRAFAAGGSGRTTGNVGGQFLSTDETQLDWSTGAQLQFNLVGSFSRFDSPFIYTPVPLTVGALVGARYDQRSTERFPAVNAFFLARYGHFIFTAENYTKRELNFGSWQTAYVAQAGVLLWPKKLLLAADFGQFMATPWEGATRVNKPQDEWQARAALHYYFWKNIGLVSLLYRQRHQQPRPTQESLENFERQVSLEIQYRY